MSSPFEKLHIPKELDLRIKLSDEDKEEIQYRYLEIGGVSQRDLAKEYGVSRRLIQFAIYPEKQKENYEQRQRRGGSKQYYSKERNTDAMRRHRAYKRGLMKKGLLVDET